MATINIYNMWVIHRYLQYQRTRDRVNEMKWSGSSSHNTLFSIHAHTYLHASTRATSKKVTTLLYTHLYSLPWQSKNQDISCRCRHRIWFSLNSVKSWSAYVSFLFSDFLGIPDGDDDDNVRMQSYQMILHYCCMLRWQPANFISIFSLVFSFSLRLSEFDLHRNSYASYETN